MAESHKRGKERKRMAKGQEKKSKVLEYAKGIRVKRKKCEEHKVLEKLCGRE